MPCLDRVEDILRTWLATHAGVAGSPDLQGVLVTVVDAGVPVLVFRGMTLVGMELTADNFGLVQLGSHQGNTLAAVIRLFS